MLRDIIKSFLMNITIVKISKNYIVGLIFEIPSSKEKLPCMSREVSSGFSSLSMRVTSVQPLASRDLTKIIFYSVPDSHLSNLESLATS